MVLARRFVAFALGILSLTAVMVAQPALDPSDRIPNWTAPPYWTPPAGAFGLSKLEKGALSPEGVAVFPSPPLPLVAISPCRLLDTRPPANNPLDGDGAFAVDEIRTYTLAGACGLPPGILAVSLNVTATNTGSGAFGHIKLWPSDGAEPNVSTLNYPGAGATVANAAVVPLSGNALKAKSGNATADLILDVNGYYALSSPPSSQLLLHHASFQGTADELTGTTKTASDGFLILLTSTAPNSVGDVRNQFGNGATSGLDRPGTYISVRARWNESISALHRFYVLAGGESGGTLLQAGFGFKAVGAALKGVSISGGVETELDLQTMLSSGTFRDLLAIRRTSSIEFFVDGIPKGSVSMNLPSSANSTYEVRVANGTSGTEAGVHVGFLTVGIPMF